MKLNKTRMLGLFWKTDNDFLDAEIQSEIKKLAKKKFLQKLGSI